MKYICYLFLTYFFTSCNVSDDEISFDHRNRYNQSVKISNFTDNEYSGGVIYFGALVEDKFYPTDSLTTTIIIPSKNTNTKKTIDDEEFSSIDVADLWVVKYEKAFALSNEATYRLKLANGQWIKYRTTYTYPNPMMGNTVYFTIHEKHFITE